MTRNIKYNDPCKRNLVFGFGIMCDIMLLSFRSMPVGSYEEKYRSGYNWILVKTKHLKPLTLAFAFGLDAEKLRYILRRIVWIVGWRSRPS